MTRMQSVVAAASACLGLALSSIAFSSAALAERPGFDVQDLQSAQTKLSEKWVRPLNSTEPDSGGEHRYIVQFEDDALPLYEGGINGLAATSAGPGGRLDPKSGAAAAYVNHLRQQQSDMVADMSAAVGVVQVERTYQHALNAVTVRMTEREANKVRSLPGVRFVERDRQVTMTTATSIGFIGADTLWTDGGDGISATGEGMVVGIIDGGINHSHPSFAATDADGYTHTNPLGSGNYLGDCLNGFDVCNDKLIGAYAFLSAQTSTPPDEILIDGAAPSTDTDGHGSHTASTAAGNILRNIPLPDADGNASSVVFPRVSGVAPHANIIAYKVCAPSCFFSDIAAAVEQAIADGVVDVLNHSIGSSPGNPWNSSQAQAFLSARAAGIFVANSAGNSGPDAGTAEAAGNAPWVAGVAATTHDRSYPTKQLEQMSGGTVAPADMTGRSVSDSFTGPIVYAGDFPTSNGSSNDTEPEQCLEPFPAGTFTPDQIVLCDRGAIARVAKGQHVRDGGAGGFILANLDGGATTVNDDPHVVPAIHVDSANGDTLRAWLADGSGHTGTITGVDTVISDPAAGDNLADFSSRGPYTGFDILAPNTAAPGVNIFAAGAELTPEQIALIHELYEPNAWESVPNEFGAISGTSMASPHIAGTAALLKQAQPGWTDAEVLSAIMTTGTYDLVKEDGVTPADIHDIGGGRVQVAAAVRAGLVLDESASAFQAANPDNGGDPSALNVAGLVQDECVQLCSWTRTVRATDGGSWTTAGLDAFVTVSPAAFTLAAGETQEIEISVDTTDLAGNAWSFGRAVLTPSDTSVPTTQLPIAVIAVSGVLPATIDLAASRDAGSQLFTDVTATAITGFNVKIYEPAEVIGMEYAVAGDSDNSDAFDDLTDGVVVVRHDVPAGTQRVRFEILESESPDLDLFVGVVVDPSNPVPPGIVICTSATGTALESCDLDVEYLDYLRGILGEDLTFFATIQNWTPSAPDAVDAFTFAATNVSDSETHRIHAEGPVGSLPPLEPFDVRFYWDIRSTTGDRYLSATEWYADAARTEPLGNVPLQFNRGVDDVLISSSADGKVNVGDVVTVTSTVQPNFTSEDRTYRVKTRIPRNMEVDPDSITHGGVIQGSKIVWDVTMESLLGKDGEYLVSTNVENPYCSAPFGGGYIDLAGFGIGPQASLTGDSFSATALTGQNPIPFFNGTRDGGFTLTDDGFGFFNSTPGPAPWINMAIPTDIDPNDMLAPFWSDWVINFDGDLSSGGERGISIATAGPDLSIIEWDGVEWYPGDGTYPVTGDFEIIMFSTVDPDFPEFIFAYTDLNPGFVAALQGAGYLTSGIENQDGTVGTEYMGAYTDDLLVCYDYLAPDSSPRELSYSATIKTKARGRKIWVSEQDVVDNPGSRRATSQTKIEVNPLPYHFKGFFGLSDGMEIDLSDNTHVRIAFALFDPLTGWPSLKAWTTVDVTNEAGEVVWSVSQRSYKFLYGEMWGLKRLEPGDYTITAKLDDGTSHSVTVTLVDNDEVEVP